MAAKKRIFASQVVMWPKFKKKILSHIHLHCWNTLLEFLKFLLRSDLRGKSFFPHPQNANLCYLVADADLFFSREEAQWLSRQLQKCSARNFAAFKQQSRKSKCKVPWNHSYSGKIGYNSYSFAIDLTAVYYVKGHIKV